MRKRDRQLITPKTLPKALQALWREYNRLYFEGSLKRCPDFKLCPTPRFLAAYSFTINKGKIKNGTIIFSEQFFYQAHHSLFKEAMLHEMSHQFVIEILKMPHHDHGPIWKMICKAVGIPARSKTPWQEN